MTKQDLTPFLATTLQKTAFSGLGERIEGKVRDIYVQKDQARRILIATDRQSAFDTLWCTIPLKGQVLSMVSAWWFKRVTDIMPTQVIETPDPNVMVVKDLEILPIEIVVRGYMTGSTKTSAWVNYSNGVRDFCGNQLPEGMVKNQQFDSPIITPTTKAEDDESIDPAGIIERGLATKEQWDQMTDYAFALFARGQKIALERDLILVDTKYEMGVDREGHIVLADEIHTPDSSRYWVHSTYEDRFAQELEPEGLDKEFFRLWLRSEGFEYGGKEPEITDEVRVQLAEKYIELFERVTGERFSLPSDPDISSRIENNLSSFRVS